MLSIFSRAFWPSICLRWRNVYFILVPFFLDFFFIRTPFLIIPQLPMFMRVLMFFHCAVFHHLKKYTFLDFFSHLNMWNSCTPWLYSRMWILAYYTLWLLPQQISFQISISDILHESFQVVAWVVCQTYILLL